MSGKDRLAGEPAVAGDSNGPRTRAKSAKSDESPDRRSALAPPFAPSGEGAGLELETQAIEASPPAAEPSAGEEGQESPLASPWEPARDEELDRALDRALDPDADTDAELDGEPLLEDPPDVEAALDHDLPAGDELSLDLDPGDDEEDGLADAGAGEGERWIEEEI